MTDESVLPRIELALRAMCSAPFSRSLYEVLGASLELQDAVEHAHGKRQAKPLIPRRQSTVEETIYQRLGSVNVNLARRDGIEMMEDAYAYARSPDPEHTPVNTSHEAEVDFLDRLVREAKHQRRLTLQNEGQPVGPYRITNLLLLHGDRGVGKTFFLDHLVAKYSQALMKHRVVWVRIDMSRNVDKMSTFTVHSRILTKAVKLLFRYYDNKFPVEDGVAEGLARFALYEMLLKMIGEGRDQDVTKAALTRELDKISDLFGRQRRNVPLDANIATREFRERCMDVSLEAGYSFLAVLDGLDRLETTQEAKESFETLVAQLIELARTSRSGLAILVVCRSSSLRQILSSPNPYYVPVEQMFEVGKADLREIVDKRKQAICNEIDRGQRGATVDTELGDAKFDLMNFIDKELDLGELERQLPGNNLRAQMQAIQLRYLEHLGRQGLRANYLLNESLVLMGREYPPVHYRYVPKSRETWERRSFDSVPLDNRLLPAIFAYPNLGPPDDPKGIDLRCLLGVRLLQLLRSYRRRCETLHGRITPIRADRVVAMLDLFGYKADTVLATLEEYDEFEVVQLSGGNSDFASTRSRYFVYPLEKARTLIEEHLFDLAYLNLAMMRMPLAAAAHTPGPPLVKAMSANSIGTHASTKRWVRIKVTNAIAALWICREANALQKSWLSDGRISKLDDKELQAVVHQAVDEDMFTFHELLAERIRQEAVWAVRKLVTEEDKDVETELLEFSSCWSPGN